MTSSPARIVRHKTRSNQTSGGLRLLLILAALLPALVLSVLAVRDSRPLAAFRDLIFDQYLRLHPRPYQAELPVRVIDIDDESLARHGQWPWPRPVLADLTQRLHKAGAAAIAFDILMAEPDRFSPEQLASRLPPSPQRTALESMAAETGQSNDAVFAKSIDNEVVITAMVGTNAQDLPPQTKHGFAFAGDPPQQFLPQMRGAILPLQAFIAPSAGIAALNFFPDRDLVVRRAPAMMMIADKPVPGLALEALRVAQQASTFVIKSSNASGETAFGAKTGIISIKTGDIEVATERDGAVRIYYSGTRPQRRIPAWRILADDKEASALSGAILFVGSSAAGMDIRATPLDAAIPGVDVHAELAEHILSGARLARPDYAGGLEAIAIVAAGISAALMVLFMRAGAGALAAAVFACLIVAASWSAFTHWGLLFDPVLPALSLLGGFGAATIVAYRTTEKDRARIRDAFGRYVSPTLVERLAANPAQLKLGGENREVTVLFSDIRNFTSRAEKLQAEEVVQFLNAVHTPMTKAILHHHGTIDKYIGDGLMAFWNAPLDDADHVRNGLRAALAMVASLPAIQSPAPHVRLDDLHIGIGIHTGAACVGNLGSDVRFDYSIVGDTVNSAARLEPLSKHYRIAIVVSEAVVDAVPDFAFLKIGDVTLRGKQSAMGIFALIGDETLAASTAFKALSSNHDAMQAARTDGRNASPLIEALIADPAAYRLHDYYCGLRDGEI